MFDPVPRHSKLLIASAITAAYGLLIAGFAVAHRAPSEAGPDAVRIRTQELAEVQPAFPTLTPTPPPEEPPPVGEEPCIPEAAFTDLDIMENLIEKAITKLGEGELDTDQLDERTDRMRDLKVGMLEDHFPAVVGARFKPLYKKLERIDFFLYFSVQRMIDDDPETAADRLRTARSTLNELRGFLQGSSQGGPAGAFTELDVMENLIEKAIAKLEKGELDTDQLDERTDRMRDLKVDMLEDHFLEVCGVRFVALYKKLERIDFFLYFSVQRMIDDDPETAAERLRTARKALLELRSLLGG